MNHASRRIAALALVAALLPLAGCRTTEGTGTSDAASSRPPVPQQRIVFDMGHGEIFGPDDTSELGQSQAIARMREAGFDVAVNPDVITAEDLAGASGLIIAGPMRPLLKEEYEAINAFVKVGGTVLLTIHVPFPVIGVPAHWGLPVTPLVMAATEPLPGTNDPGILLADQITENRLTQGVDEVLIVSGWPVTSVTKDAYLLVATSEKVWIDANNNQSREESETGSYGVIGASGMGKGTVIVAGDDAIFANIAIGQADNLQLLDNILELMHTSMEV
jgi:hypothetical protein